MRFLGKTFVRLFRREKYGSDGDNCQRVRVLLARKVSKDDIHNYSGFRGVVVDLDYDSKTDTLSVDITNGGSLGSPGHTGSLVTHAKLHVARVMKSARGILCNPTGGCIRQRNLPDPDDNKRLLRMEGAVECLEFFLGDSRAHLRDPITEGDVEEYLEKTKKNLENFKLEAENRQH